MSPALRFLETVFGLQVVRQSQSVAAHQVRSRSFRFARKNMRRLRLPLKRKEIARMINISPQYVSELLTELVEEDVLRRNGRELIIVDQNGLWHEIDFEELILNH
jgi:CRP-like cAMP-binding protein